jgi:hypothetical protein
MPAAFKTNPINLKELLEDCHTGKLQLPDFQRSWVWDEDRIRSLIASVSRAFPIGALMALETGGEVDFKPRPVEGAPNEAGRATPLSLLLDGQQRMTSLYQVTLRNQVVETVTPKNKPVKRWFYLDIRKAMDPHIDREEAIIGVPEDRVIRKDINKTIVLDVSTPEKEYAELMFPVSNVFNWDDWQEGFDEIWRGKPERELWKAFKDSVLKSNFALYQVPVITLGQTTSKEAVCVVFEKVNTGGKALDAFELVTASFAAEGYELRKDWYGPNGDGGRKSRLREMLRYPGQRAGIVAEVSNTDFLQAIALFHTREQREKAAAEGKQGKELPAVNCSRQSLLSLPLAAYKRYEELVEDGFLKAAKFLNMVHLYRTFDLPYQSQVVPLAAILADLGPAWEHEANRAKLVRWYWNGVFGELYSSAIETRYAKDFMEVPSWINGGAEPSTIVESTFRADRLKTMRMRLSAAYKGVNALLMKYGAEDFRSGQKFDHTIFFNENVDIHHIFPQAWCKKMGIKPAIFDSIINKTPLSYQTNRIIGGDAPSQYLARLEKGKASVPAISRANLDAYLLSHLIDESFLRKDDFDGFMADRQRRLLLLIQEATGKLVYEGSAAEPGEEADLPGTLEEELVVDAA